MPEIGRRHTEYTRTLLDDFSSTQPSRLKAERLAQDYGGPIIGAGKECMVLSHSEGRVIAYDYKDKTPDEAKTLFYVQNIYHTIWPHNFPHFYLSSGSVGNLTTGTVRQKIEGMKATSVSTDYNPRGSILKQRMLNLFGKNKVKYPFSRVLAECADFDIPLADMAEGIEADHNLIIGEDGGEYFIDTLTGPGYPFVELDEVGFKVLMKYKHIPSAKQEQILKWIEKNNRLAVQAKEKYKEELTDKPTFQFGKCEAFFGEAEKVDDFDDSK